MMITLPVCGVTREPTQEHFSCAGVPISSYGWVDWS